MYMMFEIRFVYFLNFFFFDIMIARKQRSDFSALSKAVEQIFVIGFIQDAWRYNSYHTFAKMMLEINLSYMYCYAVCIQFIWPLNSHNRDF